MPTLVKVDSGKVTPRVASLLAGARAAAGLPATAAKVMQGSYNRGGVSASAGTHDGGGAVDLSVAGLTGAQQLALVTELRRRNAAAWLRSPKYGWPASAGGPHIHAIVRDEPGLSAGAKAQVAAYDKKLNGLASKRPDPFARPAQYPVEEVDVTPATFKHGSMYKTPLAKPLKLAAQAKGHDIAVVDLPKGAECLLTFQVRTLKGFSKPLEFELVRLGWGADGQATDETGHAQIPPASLAFGVSHRWRTVNHVIAGGGKVAFRIYLPEGASGEYRFVCKSVTV